jgi:L-rhamnose-H+ transport protein
MAADNLIVADNVLLGSALHSVGAICAALCYTPQQKLQAWSWQTYWLAQAAICWLILPIVVAWLTVPDLATVLTEAPTDAMRNTFLLGVVYGIGGTAFGLAIRHVGYSLTYAIAIGISCILGTLTGPIVKGTMTVILDKPGSHWVIWGIVVGFVGTLLCGFAGRSKEVDLIRDSGDRSSFSLAKGLPLCLIAGVLSALYGIAVNDTGKPIAALAAAHGAGHWQTNAIYIFCNTGAFVTTALYTLFLGVRQETLKEFVRLDAGHSGGLLKNYFLAILTGCLWYSQFLFYGLGHVRMGSFKFSSWAIHMIMLILFSNLAGLAMREWVGCRRKTLVTVVGAIGLLVAAVLIITHGNHLGEQPAAG